ncbi:MAG: hypothetical protein R2873_32290 [Caldilineaceae bacterium]
MTILRDQGFEAPLLEFVQAGLPLLGICVGMQMLFDESEEMGQHEGLHLIPGKVRRFPADMADPVRPEHTLRVPNRLESAPPPPGRRPARRRPQRRLRLLRP